MANPRQRRKARSSSRKVSVSKHAQRNLKKMPPIRGPKALQEAWDKKKTVRQNYAALGLIHDLNPSQSGGAETIELHKHASSGSAPETSIDLTVSSTSASSFSADPGTSLLHTGPSSDNSGDPTSSVKPTLPTGFGRIIRDEAGNVLRIELPEEAPEAESPDDDVDMEQLEPQLEDKIRETWVSNLGGLQTRLSTQQDTSVVQELQTLSTLPPASVLESRSTLSASLTGVGSRYTSERERAYLQRLVDRYKDDVEAMARDRKLNTTQRTVGELTRALKRAGLLS